jgi:hypothetical protein
MHDVDDPKDVIEAAIRSAFEGMLAIDHRRNSWVAGEGNCEASNLTPEAGAGRADLREQAHEKVHLRRKPQTFSEAACRNERSQKTTVAVELD